MVFLSGVGVSTSLAVRIYKKHADASITIVKNEPYRLASEVWGIRFKTADTIAQAVGIQHDSCAVCTAVTTAVTAERGRRPPAARARSRLGSAGATQCWVTGGI
jgi:ATP-dependent exoDNAse (exonuclease V) alpha subunit